jgi:hypothetical protein
MPRYFFHVQYHGADRDEDGSELSDDQAAWREATKLLGAILQEINGQLQPGPEWRMEVEDGQGTVLFTLIVQSEDLRAEGSQALRSQIDQESF